MVRPSTSPATSASVNGVTRSRVARINLANGALVTTFNAGTISGNVRDMKVSGDQLYIGGVFTSVAGQPRQRLASLNPTTGAVDDQGQHHLRRHAERRHHQHLQDGGHAGWRSSDGHRQLRPGRWPRSTADRDDRPVAAPLPPFIRGRRTSSRPRAPARSTRTSATSTSPRTARSRSSSTTGAYRANTSCDTDLAVPRVHQPGGPGSDVDQLHRRRHQLRGRDPRRRGLRRRAHAVVQQPLRRRRRRTRCHPA